MYTPNVYLTGISGWPFNSVTLNRFISELTKKKHIIKKPYIVRTPYTNILTLIDVDWELGRIRKYCL